MLAPLLLALLPLAGDPPATAPALTTITLRARAVVRGSEFQLADVAEVAGPQAALAGRIGLGYCPAPGRERVLTAEQVASRATAAGIPKDRLKVLGRHSLVRVATQTISGREVAARALDAIRGRLAEGAIVEARGEAADWALPLPREDAAPEIELASDPSPIRGDGAVVLRAVAAGELLGTLSFPVRVRFESVAFVATAAQAKGQLADAARFEARRVDVTALTAEPVRDAAALLGQVLARPIPKDAVLTVADLAPAPVYRKGDQARIVVARGSLRIEAHVRVEEDAAVGAHVAVTCLEFGKTVVATVRPDGTLSLDPFEKTQR